MESKIKKLDRNLGSTIADVVLRTDSSQILDDLSKYEPVSTGFDLLDRYIGGGLKRNELLLLGGPPGVGKTIASLQIARNIARRGDYTVYYISYEHSELHLFHRLLCLESIDPNADVLRHDGIGLKEIEELFSSDNLAKHSTNKSDSILLQTLRSDKRTARALKRMQSYSDNLILTKAGQSMDLDQIRDNVSYLSKKFKGRVVVIVDYLQKVPVRAANISENERITIIVEGLKDIALNNNIPVWSVVAATKEGLQAERMHLYHMRGSSALEYEADIAIIMSNKYSILRKDLLYDTRNARKERNYVVFTIEKNRAGMAFQEIQFRIHAKNFAFSTKGENIKPETLIGSQGQDTIL